MGGTSRYGAALPLGKRFPPDPVDGSGGVGCAMPHRQSWSARLAFLLPTNLAKLIGRHPTYTRGKRDSSEQSKRFEPSCGVGAIRSCHLGGLTDRLRQTSLGDSSEQPGARELQSASRPVERDEQLHGQSKCHQRILFALTMESVFRSSSFHQ